MAVSLYGRLAEVRYLPYDLPGCVRRFLDRVEPGVGIILETELWPTLYRACGRRGVPLLIASARLSQRSVRRYEKFPHFVAAVVGASHVSVAAQSAEDAENFIRLGANPARTSVSGNIKYDQTAPAGTRADAVIRRAELGADRPVWVAGSTHEGEEDVVLDAHRRVRAQMPNALLVLAPRHPPRFEVVAQRLQRAGWDYQRRTDRRAPSKQTSVLLLDTLGELVGYYAASDVAFVGGSLVPIGGHNLLEPLIVGCPVLTGPSTGNDASTAQLLASAGATRTVTDTASLAEAVLSAIAHEEVRHMAVAAGVRVLDTNRGAVERVCAVLRPLVGRSF
jgi:3-deoxy-D-manno-octulosonic-acid transferase